MKKLILLAITFLLLSTSSAQVIAQEPEEEKATITSIRNASCEEYPDTDCLITDLDLNGEQIQVTQPNPDSDPLSDLYSEGDSVFVQSFNGNYIITGPVRDIPLFFLAGLFIIIILAIGQLKGFGSLLGLGVSIFVMFGFITPSILNGWNPILIGYLGAVAILLTSIFLSHGINRKSITAAVSSFLGMIIVSFISLIFLELASLNGFGADSVLSLISETGQDLNFRGILFASIIIAGIGVMDDITINQISALEQIYYENRKLSWLELFQKGMILGRDHIASLVNTLFIAYASASMPLMMLLQATNSSFSDIINSDQFSEEIARTLLGSISLVLVVPISTAIGAYLIAKGKLEFNKKGHNHVH